MNYYTKTLKLKSKIIGKPSYTNITPLVQQFLLDNQIDSGICFVVSPHTTCAVFFEEFVHDVDDDNVEFLQLDLNQILNNIVPKQMGFDQYHYPGPLHYQAVESWPNASEYLPGGDRRALLNADAHLKSTILGSSQVFTIKNGKIDVGSTGYIYFVDFDTTRLRERKCHLAVIGERNRE